VKLWESRDDRERSAAESTRWILWSREGWERVDEQPGPVDEIATADRAAAAAAAAGPATRAVPVTPTAHAVTAAATATAGPEVPAAPGVPGHPSAPAGGPTPAPHAEVRARRADAPIHAIIDARDVGVVFQPVFDASRGHVVGFEASARGPAGPLHAPRRLFAAARAVGRAGELDWICRAVAFRTMMDAALDPSLSLFVNVEPDALITPCPEDLLPVVWEAETRLRVFIDIAGQSLVRNPLEVLESVRRARAAGWGVVLDDLGVSAAALAVLPTLEPDVIRLDQQLLREGSERAGAALTAALAEAEQRGTTLLIDNVTEKPGTVALLGGAGYLQGPFLGTAGPLPATVRPPAVPVPLRDTETTGLTPYAVVAESGGLLASSVAEESLDRLMRQFVTQAARMPSLPVVGVVTSRYRRTTPAMMARHRQALENCPVTVLVGKGMAEFGDWRTRVTETPDGHVLAGELCLVALSATYAAVLTARPTAVVDGAATGWEVGVSHNPLTVRRVMRELLHHVDRLGGGVRFPEPA
jgi:EAL domain-containing protein (putative c-di-GMP-specific phosphodiesterase class I)